MHGVPSLPHTTTHHHATLDTSVPNLPPPPLGHPTATHPSFIPPHILIRPHTRSVRGGLNPVMQTVPADKLLVFKVGGGPRAPTSALPIGAVATADPLRVSHCVMSPELMQGVLAVSHAATPDLILSTNVAGFILVGAGGWVGRGCLCGMCVGSCVV